MPRDYTDTKWLMPSALRPGAGSQRLPSLLGQIKEWRERTRSRYLLAQLDDRMLRDAGLTRSEVERECAKYFWQR